MILNQLGKYCAQEIMLLETKRKNVEIHEYIVMPNHVHMIMIMKQFDKTLNIGYTIKTIPRRDDLVGHPKNHGNKTQLGCVTNASLQEKQIIIRHKNYQ